MESLNNKYKHVYQNQSYNFFCVSILLVNRLLCTNCSTHTSGLDELYGLDPLLVRALYTERQRATHGGSHNLQQLTDDYRSSELILVFIAIALPDLARVDSQKNGVCIFHPNYRVNKRNPKILF